MNARTLPRLEPAQTAGTDNRPVPRLTPSGELRRTLALGARLDRCRLDGATLVLQGPGVGDLLVTETGDARRILPYLSGWAASSGFQHVVYSLAGGARGLAPPGATPPTIPTDTSSDTPPAVVLDRLVAGIRGQLSPVLLVIDHAEGLLPADAGAAMPLDVARLLEQLSALCTDRAWVEAGHRLVLIGRTGPVDARLTGQPGVCTAVVGLPDETERSILLERMSRSRRRLHTAHDLDLRQAPRLTGGLLLDDLSRLRDCSTPADPLTTARVVAMKHAAMRRMAGDTLQIHEEQLTFADDIAGLPQVQRLVREAKSTGDLSLRVVLAGPSGNGKTRSSTAVAWALGVPAVSLARIRAPYVGQAEENLDRALFAISAMAPCVLIIDECDEAGLGHRSHSGEGSEVTANLRARLFGWLGDNGDRLGITVIGLTNRPDRLDPAAISRFALLPVLHPTVAEAAQIMAIQARRQQLGLDVEAAQGVLAEGDAVLSGRLAVALVGRAAVHAAARGRRDITDADVRRALSECMVTTLSPDDEYQALLAIAHTTWTAHLPWVAAQDLGNPVQVPTYAAAFVRADGGLDVTGLRKRLSELETSGVAGR